MPEQAASTPLYRFRNYRQADFDGYARLLADAERLEPVGRCTSRQFVAGQLTRPGYSPSQDLFLAETDGGVVGYMDIKPELRIGRVVLDCWVRPEHRRRGLGTNLGDHAISRSRAMGAAAAHVCIPETDQAAQAVLPKLSFRQVRRFLELSLDLGESLEMRTQPSSRLTGDPEHAYCRPLRHGEQQRLAQLQNRAFAATWGYHPNTVEEITFQIGLTTCSLADILLVFERGETVGYCWTTFTCEGGERSTDRGRVLMLGVDPDYRGRGAGKQALLAGLARLRSKGLRVAQLTVDSENKAACGLYGSLGFTVEAHTLWYERPVNQDTEAR